MNVLEKVRRGDLPYEKFLRFGPDSLTESELLAIILRTGTKDKSALELAQEVLRLCGQPHDFRFSYELDRPLRDKIEAIVRRVYGGAEVSYSPPASKELDRLEAMGFGSLPVCMAKTQYSLSDDPSKLV